VRVRRIDRHMPQDVGSSLHSPASYVLVGCIKGTPMNDATVSRSLACMLLQEVISQNPVRAQVG